jgi:hypothetical protein
VQIYLDSGAIRFKYNNQVKQWSIGFQGATPGTVQGDEHFYALGRSTRLRPISNKCSRLTQGAHFWSRAQSVNQHVQKVRGSRLTPFIIYLILFIHAAPRTKARVSRLTFLIIYLMFLHVQCRIQKVRGSWLRSLIICLMFFTCATSHTKSKRLLIDVPYHLSYAFYTRSVAYKKARGSRLRFPIIYLMLFIRAAPRIKIKGLPIEVPYFHSSNTFCIHRVNRSWLTYHHTFHTH